MGKKLTIQSLEVLDGSLNMTIFIDSSPSPPNSIMSTNPMWTSIAEDNWLYTLAWCSFRGYTHELISTLQYSTGTHD